MPWWIDLPFGPLIRAYSCSILSSHYSLPNIPYAIEKHFVLKMIVMVKLPNEHQVQTPHYIYRTISTTATMDEIQDKAVNSYLWETNLFHKFLSNRIGTCPPSAYCVFSNASLSNKGVLCEGKTIFCGSHFVYYNKYVVKKHHLSHETRSNEDNNWGSKGDRHHGCVVGKHLTHVVLQHLTNVRWNFTT